MNKIFGSKHQKNVFDLWVEVQSKLSLIQAEILKNKKIQAEDLLNKYELIYSKIKPISDDEFEFENNIFVALIKYLMESNEFFDSRFTDEEVDELLLLAYIFEWLCLEKSKDVTLLGDKGEVLKKLRFISNKTDSINKKIFENIDMDDVANWVELKRRVKKAANECFNQLVIALYKDPKIYKRILNEKSIIKSFDDKEACIKMWNKVFVINHKGLNYVYSINDSDGKIIYISIETEQRKVAFIKFKMFYTFSYENKTIKPTGISKELLRVEFIDANAQELYGEIISNSLKVANRVIKNIFLLDLQIKNEEVENAKINNFKTRKVVKIFKMNAKSEEKPNQSKMIQKTLG